MRPCNTHHTGDSKGQRASGSHVHNIFFLQTVKRRRFLHSRETFETFSIWKSTRHIITTYACTKYGSSLCWFVKWIMETVWVHYLIEESLWKLLETLGTHKALLMVQLSITIDNLLSRSKATLTSLTGRMGQGISNAVVWDKKIHIGTYYFPRVPVKC